MAVMGKEKFEEYGMNHAGSRIRKLQSLYQTRRLLILLYLVRLYISSLRVWDWG